MASFAVFILGGLVLGAICFAGGWMLRGAHDAYRAELNEDRGIPGEER